MDMTAAACFYCVGIFLEGRNLLILVISLPIDIVVCETDSVHNNHIIKSLECVDACASTLFL
jgi:hypothetical protein